MKDIPQEIDLKTLSIEALEHFKKNDYLKLFKKPLSWKKKKGIIFIAKYEFQNGKLPLVAIPFKKLNEAKKAYKEQLKPNYAPKFILLGELEMKKEKDGNIIAEVTSLKGNADIEMHAAKLFSKMKVGFRLKGGIEETDTSNEEETRTNKRKARRLAKCQKISQNLSKVEAILGQNIADSAQEKLNKELEKYALLLSQLLDEVYADGEVDMNEEAELNALTEKIASLQAQLKAGTAVPEEVEFAQIKSKFVEHVKAFKAAFAAARKMEA